MLLDDQIQRRKCLTVCCFLYAIFILVCFTLTGSSQAIPNANPIRTGEKCESPKPLLLRPANTDMSKPPLTYPELITALNAKKLPTGMTKEKLMAKLVADVKQLKVDKPLTEDHEDDLLQSGATTELLAAIRTNSPEPFRDDEIASGTVVYKFENPHDGNWTSFYELYSATSGLLDLLAKNSNSKAQIFIHVGAEEYLTEAYEQEDDIRSFLSGRRYPMNRVRIRVLSSDVGQKVTTYYCVSPPPTVF
jgi:hypothetical protein